MVELTNFISFVVLQRDQLDCAQRMRRGGASSSRGAGSPGSAARALEAAEERLREALADGLVRVSFRLIIFSLSELTYFIFVISIIFFVIDF